MTDQLALAALYIVLKDHNINEVDIYIHSDEKCTLYYQNKEDGLMTIYLDEAFPELSELLIKRTLAHCLKLNYPLKPPVIFSLSVPTKKWKFKYARNKGILEEGKL